MNKSQTDRAHAFVTWMKSKGLATLSSFLRPLNDPAGYVKRFGDKLRIPKSKRVPVELLPKSSMFEFYKPNQLRELYIKSRGRKGRENLGVGDNGYFFAALGRYVEWLRMTYPYHWKKEPMWEDKGKKVKLGNKKNMTSRKGKWQKAGNSTGYVYILTNPSFRKDWVKIGKTTKPVDTRSKQLDNTAVPLPFEIYATLKTKHMSKIETHLHNSIDLIAPRLRIRPHREFFNIKPERALKLLKDAAQMFDEEDSIDEVFKNEL